MVNKEMKFLDNGDIRYEVVDEAARSNIQTINTVLDTKADTSNVTALDTRVTGVEDDCYNSYAVGTASGTVASFSDGADDLPIKSLMVDINPVQDLHGYDSPWVAGGGKNLLNASADSGSSNDITYTKNEDGTYTINGTANGTFSLVVGSIELVANTQYILNGCPSGGSGTTYNARIRDGSYVALGFDVGTGATITPSETKTYYYQITVVSGASVSNIVFKPMIRLASIADDTYAPYENICPISGWTGCEVRRSGINIWDEEYELGVINEITGNNSGSTTQLRSVNYIPVMPNAPYYANTSGNTAIIRFYGYDKTYLAGASIVANNRVFNTPINACFMRFYLNASYGTTYNHDISINYPSSDHNYHPYTGQTISINWESEAGTVYGGKLDVITGELTVDKAMVDLETLNWTTASTRCRYELSDASAPPATSILPTNVMFSDMTLVKASTSLATYGQIAYLVSSGIQTLIAYYNGILPTGQLVYELAEPITIQLDAHEVKSLLGQNNIFANTGDIDIEYKADTTLYIERLIESNIDRAEEAKIDAQNSATQAGQSASQALTYKTDTESARDEVQSIVDSISANASQIDTNTESIASLEEDRYKSYVTDSASGAIASFTDGADDLPLKSLVVNIDPVQDLHGQDAPWVGGTGINLLKPVETTVTSNGIVVTGYEDGKVTVTGTATSDAQVELFLVSVAERRYYLILKDDINGSADTWWVSISGVAPIYSGHVNSTNFYSAGNYKLRINVKSGITINQTFYPMVAESETTYVPYENICPISGWEGMTVNACGKNLLNPNYSAYQTGYSYLFMNDIVPEGQTARFTFIDKDTSVDVSGMSIGFQNGVDLKHTAPTTYNWATRGAEIQSNVTNVRNGITCSGIFIYPKTKETFNAIFSRWNIMVELGSEATPYEPYNGQTIPIDWQTEAGTVYGGHLDVLSGVLTIINKHKVITDADDFGNYGDTGFTFKPNDMKSGTAQSGLCNLAPTVSRVTNYGVLFGSNNSTIYFAQAKSVWGVTAIADAKQWAINHGLELVYPLATPITIQLTPHEVRSLLGQNNIFADTGDCSVEYHADTKLYIERLTAPDSADMIADSNIVSGQYFMVSNALYKATANIANGGQIIVGTNCTKVSLATALNEINA